MTEFGVITLLNIFTLGIVIGAWLARRQDRQDRRKENHETVDPSSDANNHVLR